ncbi:MAG: 1-acyl-sn-glycerol-3-phosphate acyltransferase [Bacteroidia bacterium]|jgi:1-acyl-sn-glycerol-3-phosphate acyltransferase|nr:1-acyl-sn-glycerol-3-phosphate acyltransferase [Bacteroidia bacterium]
MIFLRILRVLFGIYAILIFLASLLVFPLLYALVFLLFSDTKAPHIAHRIISRVWAHYLHFFFFQPIRVKNREVLDPDAAYVFIANHRSQLDIPLFAVACKNTFRFLAKAELAKVPLMGYVIKKLYITVNRKDVADRNRSIEKMKHSLDDGVSVFICPEGTRNRKEDPIVSDFRDGAFRLAILAQRPLAVLTVFNTADKLHPNRPFEMSPGTLYARWSEPIATTGLTVEDIPALRERIHRQMTEDIRRFRETGQW